jgi:hypothetical protein
MDIVDKPPIEMLHDRSEQKLLFKLNGIISSDDINNFGEKVNDLSSEQLSTARNIFIDTTGAEPYNIKTNRLLGVVKLLLEQVSYYNKDAQITLFVSESHIKFVTILQIKMQDTPYDNLILNTDVKSNFKLQEQYSASLRRKHIKLTLTLLGSMFCVTTFVIGMTLLNGTSLEFPSTFVSLALGYEIFILNS